MEISSLFTILRQSVMERQSIQEGDALNRSERHPSDIFKQHQLIKLIVTQLHSSSGGYKESLLVLFMTA